MFIRHRLHPQSKLTGAPSRLGMAQAGPRPIRSTRRFSIQRIRGFVDSNSRRAANMNIGILVLSIVSLCAPLSAGGPQSKEQADMTNTKPRTHATATITVQNSEAKAYDQTAGPKLMEIHLNETFIGDLDGESPVRALQVLRDDKSASLVSVQRFHGK